MLPQKLKLAPRHRLFPHLGCKLAARAGDLRRSALYRKIVVRRVNLHEELALAESAARDELGAEIQDLAGHRRRNLNLLRGLDRSHCFNGDHVFSEMEGIYLNEARVDRPLAPFGPRGGFHEIVRDE
ncbi:MAG: hypothetical protein BWY06_01428 [Candidatus Latescibacteria bacterium ADurb.Bin168]|nr:MAG: hypothetical protein BWY06_01428 [Candidatus Latescibacteria bacterium ADurb.Bin168]